MVALHLARVALENLVSRPRRSLFLVLGVAVGAGTLSFLLAVHGGLDALVRRNLGEHRRVLEERAALAGRHDALIATLPVSRLVVRARAGDVSQAQVRRLAALPGVARVEPVAFLFPVILGVTPRDLDIPGVPERELQRELKLPTTLYGLPEGYLGTGELLPGKRLSAPPTAPAPPGPAPAPGDAGAPPAPPAPVPVVLPASLLDFLATLRSEEMVDRFAEIAHARLERAMERRPKLREDVLRSLQSIPGVDAISGVVIKKVIRDAVRTFLERVDAARLPASFELALYPGLEEGSLRVPLEVVGYSARTPGGGLAVSMEHLAEWNRRFQEETEGALSRLLGGGAEVAYAEVHLHTAGFAASKLLRARLQDEGWVVDSSLDEALRVERDLLALSSEADRIAAEARRVEDLSGALGRGAGVFSGLLFLLAGAVIVNGLTLSVLEQQRRIGIFRAVGATRAAVLGIFLLEAAVVGALGSAAGVLAADAGLVSAAPRLAAGLAGAEDAAALFDPGLATQVSIALLGTAVSLLAGLLPALQAAAVQPVEVLKH